jgi:hypothetical protein
VQCVVRVNLGKEGTSGEESQNQEYCTTASGKVTVLRKGSRGRSGDHQGVSKRSQLLDLRPSFPKIRYESTVQHNL